MSTTQIAPPRMTVVDSGTEDGIQWATCRAPLYGAINGYVRIPDGHPWAGLDYDDIDVKVHGGLTFGDGEWIGFDALHLGDYWPGQPYGLSAGDRYWTAEQVADETRELARQVAATSTLPAGDAR